MTDVETARAAWAAAAKALRDLEEERAAAARAAAERVRAEYSDRMAAAIAARAAANRARIEAENAAAPTHEWEGKVVVIREPTYKRWSSTPSGHTERRGVVFSYRHGDDLGPGYKFVQPGSPMVRLLKKDGTPGRKTEKLAPGRDGVEWTLAE